MTSQAPARIAAAAAGAVLALAAVWAGVAAPWPAISGTGPGEEPTPPRVEVTPVPSETVLSCDGPILALGRDPGDAQGLTPAVDASATLGAANGQDPDESRSDLAGVADMLRVSQLPEGAEPASVAASVAAEASDDDIAGFAASACRAAQPESWLVGASVQTGTTDILIVSNPSDVAATVSVDVFGTEGRVSPPSGEFAVRPRSAVALPVAGLAGTEQSPALRVTSEGAPVVATLQSSQVSTLDPTGLDLQQATMPARSHVIPRVTVTPDAAESGEAAVVLRMLATAGSGTAYVTVVGRDSGRTVLETSVDLTSGEPVTVGLPDLRDSSYAVRIDAEVPVVAAAQQLTARDYAWATPAEPISQAALVAVPRSPGDGYALALAAGAEDATVRVERVDGSDPRTVDVPAGRTVEVEVDEETLYRIVPEQSSVAASVGYATEQQITTFAVAPDPATPEPVSIAP